MDVDSYGLYYGFELGVRRFTAMFPRSRIFLAADGVEGCFFFLPTAPFPGFRALLPPFSEEFNTYPVETSYHHHPRSFHSLLALFDVYLYSIDRDGGTTWIPSPILLLSAQKLRFHLRLWVVLSHCEGGREEGPATPAYMGRRPDAGEASGGSRRKPPAEVPFLSRKEVYTPFPLIFVYRLLG